METILHELSHNHLFVKGQVQFNESFATFVGRAGAIRFFCGPDGAHQNTPECQMARERWEDYQGFSRFLGEFLIDLRSRLWDPGADGGRQDPGQGGALLGEHRTRHEEGGGSATSPLVRGFLNRPLNNAILLARMRYFHRLSDFQALLDQHEGDLRGAVAAIAGEVKDVQDPFALLPGGG